jgi:cytochrome P450
MDPDFHPSPPTEPYFDTERDLWVLSRFADVSAALRERALYQATPEGEEIQTGADEASHSVVFSQVRAEIAEVSSGGWREKMQAAGETVIREATGKAQVDIMGDVTHPWSIALLLSLSPTPQSSAKDVADIVASLLYEKEWQSGGSDSQTGNPALKRRARWNPVEAEERLDQMQESKEVTVSKAMFMAVSRTLPSFLAKSWLALLRNPDQWCQLQANPQLMPNAVEELLRYAGIVHTLQRKAHREVVVGGVRIPQGAKVALKVMSANFDPVRFSEPYRLDMTRKPSGQFGLGAGLHACVGALLVREAFTVLTPIFFASNPMLESGQHITWMGKKTLHWPLAVFVRFEDNAANTAGTEALTSQPNPAA